MRLKARVLKTAFSAHQIVSKIKKHQFHVSCAQVDQFQTRIVLNVHVSVPFSTF